MQTIEQRLDALEHQVSALQAKAEIAELMGRYAVYYGANCGKRIMDELFRAGEDISLEFGASGVYQRRWQIMTFYSNEAYPGRLNTLSFSSPAIVVSADGCTAKGSWTAYATETDSGELGPVPVAEESNRSVLYSSQTEDGKRYRAEVMLQRYEVDFCCENGSWKIQHLHVIEYFRCPWTRDWVQYAKERMATDGMWLESLFVTPDGLPEDAHGENLPNAASTYHWQYTTDCKPGKTPDFLSDASVKK